MIVHNVFLIRFNCALSFNLSMSNIYSMSQLEKIKKQKCLEKLSKSVCTIYIEYQQRIHKQHMIVIPKDAFIVILLIEPNKISLNIKHRTNKPYQNQTK